MKSILVLVSSFPFWLEPKGTRSLRSWAIRRMAEAVGFEPTEGSPLRRFSRPVPSTARPRFQSQTVSPVLPAFTSLRDMNCGATAAGGR